MFGFMFVRVILVVTCDIFFAIKSPNLGNNYELWSTLITLQYLKGFYVFIFLYKERKETNIGEYLL